VLTEYIILLGQKYQQVVGSKAKGKKEVNVPSIKSTNPLDNLDCKYILRCTVQYL